jgi:membrane protease YdiL (CAAX protease family)
MDTSPATTPPDLPPTEVTTAAGPSAVPALRPMGLPLALLFFGIPSAVFSISLLVVLPWLLSRGVSRFATFNIAFGTPLALLLLASAIAFRLEGRPWRWTAFRDRMRLQAMGRREWLWTLALVVYITLFAFLPPGWTRPFASIVFYHQPAALADFMRNFVAGNTVVGHSISWGFFLYYLTTLVVLNIGGEELWWRGYILPRQELAHGAWAWVANGTLWALFHAFYHWNLASLVGMLPVTLGIAFVAQRTKSTWPGCIAHTVANSTPLLFMLKALL